MDLIRKSRYCGGLFCTAFLLFLTLANTAQAFSGPTMTEVMYDAPASDQGREWVEITNFGNSSVDVGKYILFESNTNHKLTIARGSAILGQGESAIVTTDPSAFASSYPNFLGTIFKAAFSLSNSGETLAIKNASSTILDSVTYDSSMGAAGDGASLHRTTSGMKAGEPDPGVYAEVVAPLHAPAPPTTTKTTPATTEKPSSTKVANAASPAVDQTVAVSDAPIATAEAPAENDSNSSFIEAGLGLLALVVIGIASVWYAKGVTSILVADKETQLEAGEFDIES